MKQQSIIVIGAGMAGLAAAQHLTAHGIAVQVLERDRRPGGRILTEDIGGLAVDSGAQILASFCTHALGLIQQFDLTESLHQITGNNGIVRDGHLYELPNAPHVVLTPLLSPGSKLTLLKALWPVILNWRLLDVHEFARASLLDTQSIAAYAKSELSEDTLNYLLAPLLSGILYYDPERTSQALLFLMLKAAFGMKLYTLDGGISRLPIKMAARLPIAYATEVRKVESAGSAGYLVHARIDGEDREIPADGIVCATPASGVANMFAEMNEVQRDFFDAVRYTSTVALAVALDQSPKSNLYDFFCAAGETRYLAAATIHSGSSSYPAPHENNVIELFSSDLGARHLLTQDDQAVRDLLWADIQRIGFLEHDLDAQTVFRVRRWPEALPAFDVGHFKRLATFEQGAIETGNVVFAGDYLGGPFIDGAITSGLRAAERLLARLGVAD
jgi:oxygen-dependent protoporphyrinogen oxidase